MSSLGVCNVLSLGLGLCFSGKFVYLRVQPQDTCISLRQMRSIWLFFVFHIYAKLGFTLGPWCVSIQL